ncbi:MAG: hypothetical protein ACRD0Z_10060 [Acidimicrobiales bacterium]
MAIEDEQGRPSSCVDVFLSCSRAIADGVLIRRVSRGDKEFHFQNWVTARLADANLAHDPPRRNLYPDFTLVNFPEGYEVKGLAYPGREATYDSNSRVPSGLHNGRTIFYVFGRYPPETAGDDTYPVVDLVLCHGDFINADHDYVHKNRNFRCFGSYGDVMVRDRKMYVAPTPFNLTVGTTGQQTLIVPAGFRIEDERLQQVGEFSRLEADNLVVGYSFDLIKNVLDPQLVPNPNAGREHRIAAYRRRGVGVGEVSLQPKVTVEEPDDDEE